MKTLMTFAVAITLLFAFTPLSLDLPLGQTTQVQSEDQACGLLRVIGRGLRGVGRGVGRAFGAGRSC